MKLFNLQFPILKPRKIAKLFSATTLRLLLPNPSTFHPSRGYSLVEVLVAITVLMVALVGPLTIAQAGLQKAMKARDHTMAVFMAQEGIEAVFKLREDAAMAAYNNQALNNISQVWKTTMDPLNTLCASSTPCGVTIGATSEVTPASFYRCNATNCIMRYDPTANVPYRQNVAGGTVTPYKREITIVVNDAHAIVNSRVSWGNDDSVVLKTYIYNIYHEIE